MKYLSVCSGIEAASVAWHHLGWTPAAFAEVEPFPSAVLKHHYPNVVNHGDMIKFMEWPNESIDLLVGGTPCQSFSLAGLRKGLADPRGNLMLTYLAIADRYRPKWIVWENVPGVLSSNGGRDFGTFLGALVELGYGFAFRILDAQWFGVAQRRRRVFVVGYLGDASRAAKVLFERESVCRYPAPSREKKQGTATSTIPSVAGSLDTECGGGKLTHQSVANGHIIGTITARMFNALGARDVEEGALLPVSIATYDMKQHHNPQPSNTAQLITKNCAFIRGDTPLATIAFHPTQDPISSENISHALGTGSKSGNATTAVAFESNRRDGARVYGDTTNTLQAFAGTGGGNSPMVQQSTAVRRLTPTECERLQGFPDGYTNIPWRKKTESPDGPRYKALGNSMAVPVMRWIGERINQFNKEQSRCRVSE